MKTLYKACIFLLSYIITNVSNVYSVGNPWELITINEYPFLSQVYFFDNENGLALSPYAIFKSTDGGYKWNAILESSEQSKMFVHWQIKDSIVYLLRSDGIILKSNLDFTQDSMINISIPDYYQRFLVIDHNKMVLLSITKKSILITNDGGKTWELIDINNFASSKYLLDIIFVTNETGFVCSDDGKIYKTTNFGKTWNAILDIGIYIDKLFYLNENNIWFGTIDGKIYYTTDGGNNWEYSTLPENLPVGLIYFLNNQEGFVSSVKNSSGILYSTKDGSKTWSLDYSFNQKLTELQYIFFYENRIGWCVGNSGLILKLSKGSYVNENESANTFFPNPARSTTHISLQKEGDITIYAVDVLGRSFPLWSGYASAGDKELDVSTLPTGSYTLLIDYGTKREAVRMIKQ